MPPSLLLVMAKAPLYVNDNRKKGSFVDSPLLTVIESSLSWSVESWDCVATCFFIDTAHNVIEYMETIWKILKPGGAWINLGESVTVKDKEKKKHFYCNHTVKDHISISYKRVCTIWNCWRLNILIETMNFTIDPLPLTYYWTVGCTFLMIKYSFLFMCIIITYFLSHLLFEIIPWQDINVKPPTYQSNPCLGVLSQ